MHCSCRNCINLRFHDHGILDIHVKFTPTHWTPRAAEALVRQGLGASNSVTTKARLQRAKRRVHRTRHRLTSVSHSFPQHQLHSLLPDILLRSRASSYAPPAPPLASPPHAPRQALKSRSQSQEVPVPVKARIPSRVLALDPEDASSTHSHTLGSHIIRRPICQHEHVPKGPLLSQCVASTSPGREFVAFPHSRAHFAGGATPIVYSIPRAQELVITKRRPQT